MGVAPKSYRCHQAFGSVHATALSVTHTGDCNVQASHRLIRLLSVSFGKATGTPSAGRGRERPRRPGRGSRLLVVEYRRSCVSEDEFYF